jgi:hypothetical protein
MYETCRKDKQVENLVTCTDEVEAMWKPSLWQLRSVSFPSIPTLQ